MAPTRNFNVDEAEDFGDGTRARTYSDASSEAADEARGPAPALRVRNWEADESAAYAGRVVARKEVSGGAGGESPDEDAIAAWSDAEPFGASDSEEEEEEADDGAEDEEEEAEEEESDDGGDDDNKDAEKLMRGFAKADSAQLMSAKDSAKLVEKALHVRHQKILWERFLEVQIYTKRLLSTTKAATDAGAAQPSDASKAQAVERLYACIAAVSSLQTKLCNIPELLPGASAEAAGRKRKRTSSAVDDVWADVSTASAAVLPQYNEVLNAYARQTRLAGGSQAKKFKAVNQDVLAQVDAVLADVQRVKRKAHAPLDGGGGDGSTSAEEGDGDALDELMYDDADFYQQLLKEFIESGGGGDDALQPRAHRKKRKAVNRKGSKGRQLRYTVHPKLENFMFPDPYPKPAMDVDELFRSLFGQVRPE